MGKKNLSVGSFKEKKKKKEEENKASLGSAWERKKCLKRRDQLFDLVVYAAKQWWIGVQKKQLSHADVSL